LDVGHSRPQDGHNTRSRYRKRAESIHYFDEVSPGFGFVFVFRREYALPGGEESGVALHLDRLDLFAESCNRTTTYLA